MSHVLPHDCAFFVEATLGTPPADWSASGTNIKLLTDLDVTGRDVEMLDNENTTSTRFDVLDMVQGLKSGSTFTSSIYFTAAGATAVEAAQATATAESTVIKAALGGRRLGWSIGLVGTGTVSVVDLDADPGYTPGDWVGYADASTGILTLHRIESLAGVAATLLNDLPQAPDDAADIFHATILSYPDEGAMNSPTDANNTTLSWFIQGEGAEDRQEFSGCKPTLAIETITAGENVKLTLEHAVTTWPDADPAKITIPGAASGIAPVVPSTGQTATVWLADVGSPLALVDCRGAIDPQLGYAWSGVKGVCGTEGVKGYTASDVIAGLEMRVDFDDDYQADFVAKTKKHCLIQLGNLAGNTIGIYYGNLEFSKEPDREVEDDQAVSLLNFRAHIDPGDTTALTPGTDEFAQRVAPVTLIQLA